MDISEVEKKSTLTVVETSEVLGLGLRQTYEAVRKGEIYALKIGGKYLVPTKRLLALLAGSPNS